MDAVTSFYERLITNSSPIEPALQVRIIEHLARGKAFALLGKFATRTDLSEAAEVLIVARDEAHVLAGWASRPGRTHDELTSRLGSEKRVTTLLPLAKMHDLPVEIYLEIAKRPSVKLTEALMVNPSVPEEIKLSRILEIASILDGRSGWRADLGVAEVAGKSATLLHALAEHSCRPSVLLTALADEPVEIPSGMIASLFERIDRFPKDDDARLADLLVRLSIQDLTTPQIKKLRAVVNLVVRESKNSYWFSGSAACATAKHLLSEKGRKHAAQIRSLATSTDVEESQKLLRELLGTPKSAANTLYCEAVYPAIAVNTVLPAELVKQYLDEFSGLDESRLVATWCARGEVKALAEHALEAWSQPEWLEKIKDPQPILEAVVSLARSKDEPIPNWLMTHPAVYDQPGTAMMFLPWQSLHQVSNVSQFSSDENVDVTKRDLVVDAAQKLIAERMGTDPQKWEVFATLANEFEGTLPDLLDAVEAIAV
jgi:hypothetical protein